MIKNMVKVTLVIMFAFLIQSCTFSKKACLRMLEDAKKYPYDIVIVPGVPFEDSTWSRTMKGRIYWSKYLYDNGITKNVMYSGSAVYTPYTEGEIMALYGVALGIPEENVFSETMAEHSTENVYYSYKKARKLGFGRIALATDQFQAKMLKRFTKKIVSPDVGIIPIVADTLESLLPLMVNPEIDYQKTFVNNFTPLTERENFRERFRGTRGVDLDTALYK